MHISQTESDSARRNDIEHSCYELDRFADPNRVQNLSAEMFERRNYPRLKERLEKEKNAANIRRIKVSVDFVSEG